MASDKTCFIHRVKMTTEDRECNWNWAIDIKKLGNVKNPVSCFELNILTVVENEYTLSYGYIMLKELFWYDQRS